MPMKRLSLVNSKLVAISMAGMLALCSFASVVQAQVQATVEISSQASELDPHPSTYAWSGSTDRVRDPVQYYTFFYTGTVDPDATVPLGITIQRIAISNNEWTANKEAIVNRLTAFYEELYGILEPEVTQPALAGPVGGLGAPPAPGGPGAPPPGLGGGFVDFAPPPAAAPAPAAPGGGFIDFSVPAAGGPAAGAAPGGAAAAATTQAATVDPRAAAEWTFFLDQVVLWQFYCRRVLLSDTGAARANSDEADLVRDLARMNLLEELGDEAENIDIDRVLDQGLGEEEAEDEEAAAGAGAAGPADGAVGLATAFDVDAIHADVFALAKYRSEFLRLAEEREDLAVEIYNDMLDRINKRREDEKEFEFWLEDRENELIEFARAWGKVHSGERIRFGDTLYLISENPLQGVPRNARNIVAGEVITPQDLLSADGRLKG
ncbi:hypothetical protein IIC65_09430, partial [Candidatus Sumerlaeota bacterium]|nr:hypothetical protein [Candidatus Sumerlaeota bacterium]